MARSIPASTRPPPAGSISRATRFVSSRVPPRDPGARRPPGGSARRSCGSSPTRCTEWGAVSWSRPSPAAGAACGPCATGSIPFSGEQPGADRPSPGRASPEVRKERAAAGFATDGDADRLRRLRRAGPLLSPLTLLPVWRSTSSGTGASGDQGWNRQDLRGSLRMERIRPAARLPFYDLPWAFKHVARSCGGNDDPAGRGRKRRLRLPGLSFRSGRDLSRSFSWRQWSSRTSPLGLVPGWRKEYGKSTPTIGSMSSAPPRWAQDRGEARRGPARTMAGLRVTDVNRLDGSEADLRRRGGLLFRPQHRAGAPPLLRGPTPRRGQGGPPPGGEPGEPLIP